MNIDTVSMRESAMQLASQGFRVHPLYPICWTDGTCMCGNPNCQAVGKHPRWHDWPKKATSQPSIVELHWQAHPDDGIGIATGEGLVVVDLDGDEGLLAWEALGQKGVHPWLVTTGRGLHLYYRTNEPLPNSARRLGPGIDTRGDGGYVVAPPTLHKNGNRYEWFRHEGEAPPWLPSWVRDKLQEREFSPTELDWDATDGICGWPFGGVIAGERNVTMTRYVGALYAAGLNDDEVYTLTMEANRTYVSPPLAAHEIKTITRSISKAENRKQEMRDPDPLLDKPLLSNDNAAPVPKPDGKFRLVKAATIKVEEIDWVWPAYLGRKIITNLAGDGGVGKSVLTVDLAARLSRGAAWPDGAPSPGPSDVVLLNAEDDASTVLVPRLVAAGADLSRVHIGSDLLRFPADLDELSALCSVVGPALLVIDPIMAFLDSRIDPNDQAKVTMLLTRLTQLAIKQRMAIVIVQHLRKGDGAAIYKTSGSTAWLSRARVGLQAVKDKNEKGRVLLTHVKGNYAEEQPTWAYSKRNYGGHVCLDWDSNPVDLDADSALAAPSSDERTAREWLSLELSSGGVALRDIEARARDAGIAALDLTKARMALRVEKRQSAGLAPSLHLPGVPDFKIQPDEEMESKSSDLTSEDEWA